MQTSGSLIIYDVTTERRVKELMVSYYWHWYTPIPVISLQRHFCERKKERNKTWHCEQTVALH